MIEDMTHMAVLQSLADELQETLVKYNTLCNGKTDKKELLRLRLEQNDLLAEICRKQKRHLRYMNGEQIEPEAHFVEAVLYPVGGFHA